MSFGFGKRGGNRGHAGRGSGRRAARRRHLNIQFENCICPVCGSIAPHHPGVPCYQTACPTCGTAMTRQIINPDVIKQPVHPVSTAIPEVNPELCTGCGRCVQACSVGAISVINGMAVIHESRCTGCNACVAACPKAAIS